MLSFFLRGVLDEILNLIESVSEEFPSYSYSFSVYYVILHAYKDVSFLAGDILCIVHYCINDGIKRLWSRFSTAPSGPGNVNA